MTYSPESLDIAPTRIGRPPGSSKPDSDKKGITLQVRVTPGIAELIKKGADRVGAASSSQFVRQAINDKLDQMGIY